MGIPLGLVLSQLNRGGAPCIMNSLQPSPIDVRTMVTPYADPQRGTLQTLARFCSLPSLGRGGVSDAKIVDQLSEQIQSQLRTIVVESVSD